MSDHHSQPGSTLRTRPSLLLRVRDWGDREGWEEFHQLYRRLVYGRARRCGLGHEDAEDVAQEVFKRIAETLTRFDPDPSRGSFRGWLMQLTQWRIADKLEERGAEPARPPAPGAEAARRTRTTDRVPCPPEDEDAWDREWREHVLAAAAERIARRVRPRHFQVFDLYVRRRWPVRQVASVLGVNPASVYVIAHRVTRRFRAEVAKLERQCD